MTAHAATSNLPRTGVFAPAHFTLGNGMQVVAVVNRRAPVVAHWVWYGVGTADSPPGKSGLAHFVEHLMFKGTKNIPAGEFSKIVARQGGEDNAMTSYDFTAYFQNIAADRLPMMMGMEAERMGELRLTDADVYPERDVILEERRLRVDNEPSALLSEQLQAAQYLHHPYRLPVIGWLHEIEGYTRADAEAFYEHWYTPANAVLVVSGDVEPERLRDQAEASYGRVASRPAPPRPRVAEPPQHAERRLELADERVKQPNLIRSYLAPSRRSIGHEHADALQVLAEVLGGGSTSRLYRRLVVEAGLATDASCYYSDAGLEQTTLRLVTPPRPEVELDRLEAALDQELGRLTAEPVTAEELAPVKRRMLAEAVFARDSLGAPARAFGVAFATGGGVDDVETWPARIAAVEPEAILAAAKTVVRRASSVTGRLLPAAVAA